MQGPDLRLWLDRLDAERENLRAAIGFAAAEGDADTALALCGSWRYWTTRGNLAEGRALASIALATGKGAPELRLGVLNSAGVLAGEQGDFAAARALFEESVDLAQRHGVGPHGSRVRQPRKPRALRGQLRRGDPPLRAGGCVLARAGRRALAQRRDAEPGLGLQRRRRARPRDRAARRRAWRWRASRAIRRMSRRRCARSPAPSCSAPASPHRRSSCCGKGSRCRSSSTSAGISSTLETLAAVVEPRTGAELIGAAERRARQRARAPARRGGVGRRRSRRTCAASLGDEAFARRSGPAGSCR